MNFKEILPEFQEFLVARNLAQKKHVSFLANWVSKFLVFRRGNEDEDINVTVARFLDMLRDKGDIEDWQVIQADSALRLYIHHFKGGDIMKVEGEAFTPKGSLADKTELLAEMRKLLRIKHYSYRTEVAYLDWAGRFFAYMREISSDSSAALTSDVLRDYLSHLAVTRRVSASTQNQAFNALLFLFRDVLKQDMGDLSSTVRAKRGSKLPVVLSIEEVRTLLDHLTGTSLLIARILYGSGLRIMEAARLRVLDVDFDGSLIVVRSGKGDKDRTTILPETIKDSLKSHLQEVKTLHEKDLSAGHGEVYLPDALQRKYRNAAKEWKWQYVFPSARLSVDPRSGKVRRHHVSDKAIQTAFGNALRKAGIAKHATVHTLRHSFATHLLMSGVNIREVQSLLGHKSVETTMIYTHVVRDMQNVPMSPLDSLLRENE
ncbi:MAG: integron integrase [Candidatus Sulfobium sp.]|jgi:integron integrase